MRVLRPRPCRNVRLYGADLLPADRASERAPAWVKSNEPATPRLARTPMHPHAHMSLCSLVVAAGNGWQVPSAVCVCVCVAPVVGTWYGVLFLSGV